MIIISIVSICDAGRKVALSKEILGTSVNNNLTLVGERDKPLCLWPLKVKQSNKIKETVDFSSSYNRSNDMVIKNSCSSVRLFHTSKPIAASVLKTESAKKS